VFYISGVFLSRYVDYFATARIRNTEKIPVNGKDVECYVVELAQRGWTLQNQLLRYTWWVDTKKFIVWREDLERRPSSTAAWEWMSSSNFEEVILNAPLPKDTFVFTPPEGSRLVERPAQ
jgi:outer membrane lipoprotein-sorting protein